MVTITLPDNSKREFPGPITGEEIAAAIGPGLAKAALAIRVDGKLLDLYIPIEKDASIQIITGKDADGLELIRHDTAHLLAEAVKELFPETQVTIGPAIENGFYYDFSRKMPFSSDDLAAIENRMKEIVARNEQVRREVWKRDEAVKFFKSTGEEYKAEIISAIPAEQDISLYRQGEFIDLCRGPHAPSTGKVGTAFKLTHVAGAYWRGDHRNEMLQRIYGTAWASEKDLKNYLTMLEEADKRDHRRLAKELDLFHIEEHTPGMIFWHDKGWSIYRTIENFVRHKIRARGYIEVKTPILVDRSLWEASGHWEKFRENMFVTNSDEEHMMAVKPMNCPCHIQIFKQGLKSYRDLPLRMAEFGSCHRNESSGSLHGIMRLRGFVQDDAHIFCTEEQITSETVAFCALLKDIYKAFGFTDVKVKFSDRPTRRAGADATWDKAENALKSAVSATGLEWSLNPGEGAFYGPKLEFILRDAIGRDWQCGTLQVDFVLPERLDAEYIGADGGKHRPVMLHRAVLGSLERFIGILIEEYAGKFPLWLAPVQAVVATITEAADAYARQVHSELLKAGVRAGIDIRNEKINYKVREHSLQKVPVMFVVGSREQETKSVSIRRLGSEKQEIMGFEEALAVLVDEAGAPG
ncbi:MAG: threonine--tRNA ligase [Pseudomonadota bacterium]|nr:threonine--tRNA ligase [Pseudomonadota bacterium]MDE3038220.1 threonine--tRNA ligase [Pseudomonadota bacterium]